LQDSDSDGVEKIKKQYRQFNEKHNLKIPVTFVMGDQFVDTYFFKRVLKTFVVQNEFDYHYKHNDKGKVNADCREEHCLWRIHASINATSACIQIKTLYLNHTLAISSKTPDAMLSTLLVLIRRTLRMIPHGPSMLCNRGLRETST
jgi:hypothetical protein